MASSLWAEDCKAILSTRCCHELFWVSFGKSCDWGIHERWLRSNSRGEVACMYAAGDCVPGMHDEMMGYQAYLEDVLDQALA